MRFYAALLFSGTLTSRSHSEGDLLASQIFAKKSIDKLISDSERPGHGLPKSLGPWSLTALGIGAIIGSGIFVLTGTAAAGEIFHSVPAARPGAGRLSESVSARESFRCASPRPSAGRTGNRDFISSGGDCLQFCGSVLCRACLDDTDCGKRVYVFLRDFGRIDRMDHWLGPDFRICGEQRGCGSWLWRILESAATSFGLHIPDNWSSPVWTGGHWSGALLQRSGVPHCFYFDCSSGAGAFANRQGPTTSWCW